MTNLTPDPAYADVLREMAARMWRHVHETGDFFWRVRTVGCFGMRRWGPLKENDAVAGVLADFAATIEALRIIGYQCARMCDRSDLYGDLWSQEVVAKARAHRYFAADICLEAIGKVMNLMEAYGADRDWDVEKHWRDMKILQLVEGGKQLCQMEVARWFFDCETL